MKWNIVTDSGSDLAKEKPSDDIGLSVVPIIVMVGETEYIDDTNMDILELLDAMSKEKISLSTACPSPHAFFEEYKKADFTICITITSGLSATHNSAVLAVDMLKEEFPDKKVLVIDSKATATKMVVIKRKAEKLIREGKTFEEISEILPKYAEDAGFVFALGAYDNLVKTGRMSKTAGLLATTVGIRAVATASEMGTIEVIKKPRGEKNAINEMVEYAKIHKKIEDSFVVIGHCNNLEGAMKLKEKVIQELNPKEIEITECSGLNTFYTMQNGLLLGF
ncbi:MAG: DegV family protein [Clostridia bacterium]